MIRCADLDNFKDTLGSYQSHSLADDGRRNAIYIPDDQAAEFLSNLSIDVIDYPQLSSPQKTRSSRYLRSPCIVDEDQCSNGYDAHTDCIHNSNDSGLCDSWCVRDKRDGKSTSSPLLEQEFITAISRTFSLPHTGGELDWLKGMDAPLYQNPMQALFESAFEEMSGDAETCGEGGDGPVSTETILYDSFLHINDDEDEGVDTDSSEEESSGTYDQSDTYSCRTECCSSRHEKQLIHIILPQAVRYDTWKRPVQPKISRKRKFISFAHSVARTLVNGHFWKRS